MKKTHLSKIMAAIIVAVVIILYYAGYAAVFMEVGDEIPIFFNILFLCIPVFAIVATVYVLIERIKEIEKGEEDDLDNY